MRTVIENFAGEDKNQLIGGEFLLCGQFRFKHIDGVGCIDIQIDVYRYSLNRKSRIPFPEGSLALICIVKVWISWETGQSEWIGEVGGQWRLFNSRLCH